MRSFLLRWVPMRDGAGAAGTLLFRAMPALGSRRFRRVQLCASSFCTYVHLVHTTFSSVSAHADVT